MDFTVRQKAGLRALAVIAGLLTMTHILKPHAACAAELISTWSAVTADSHGLARF